MTFVKKSFKNILILSVAMIMVSPLIIENVSAQSSAQSEADRAREERNKRDGQRTKKSQAVSKSVYEKITKAQEIMEAGDNDGALKILNALRASSKLSEYEQQNVLNYLGFVYYNMEDYPRAMRAYEDMLKIPSIEEQMAKTTTYTLAQLNTMEENYTKAISLIQRYFQLETNPPPAAHILYAQNLYQLERYKEMIPPIETAMENDLRRQKAARQMAKEKAEVELKKARGEEEIAAATVKLRDATRRANMEPIIKEDWYSLLNFAYFQQENFSKVRDIQKILLIHYPKKRYWFSLAGAYTELGEDEKLIYAYDAAHTQNMLEKSVEFVTMAQLYMQAEVPYKAATLLDKEINSGRVDKNEKNYRLLSQAYTLAAEDEKALPALKAAAKISDEGEMDLRLGNAYLNLAMYGDCVTSVRAGLKKGKIKSPDNAQISLGMCLYNEKEYLDAIKAFKAASKTNRSRRIAGQWISVIESDIERNRQIDLAEAAAKKQLDDLKKRRDQAAAARI